MPMSCSVSPISGTRSVETLFGLKHPVTNQKPCLPINCYRELGLVHDSSGHCWVVSKWVTATRTRGCLGFEKQLFGSSFNLQTRFEPFLELVSYTYLRAHETLRYIVCRLLLEKKTFI
mgnify:CR=1 FL=1